MQVLERDTFTLHWREDGDPNGKPIVFSNSLGTDLRIWDDVVAALPPGLRVIRYDSRGHGLSDCPDGTFDITDLAEDVVALLDHLDIESCVFVGLSIGGKVGQYLGYKHSERLAGLVLCNTDAPAGDADAWGQRITVINESGIEALADPVMERWFSAAFRAKPELAPWRNMLTTTSEKGYIGSCMALTLTDLQETSAQIKSPTLVIGGSEDEATPPQAVEAMAKLIQGARFELIDGVGHIPCVEAPAELARLVAEFMKEIKYV